MKHHYVPAFYLRSFVDTSGPAEYEPYLWVVDLDTGRTRRQSPENTAALTDYYAVGDGDSRHDVEKHLSEVEGKAAPVVGKLLAEAETIEGDDKRVLSYFAALQIVRVPAFRHRIEAFISDVGQTLNTMVIQSRDRYESALRQAMPDRIFTAEEVERLYAAARDVDSYRIVANPEAALGHALGVVPKIADLLNRMSWAVMESAGVDNYWSSDNPIHFINPASEHPYLGHALGARDVEVTLPLGPRRCLLMAWSDIAGPRTLIQDPRPVQERGIVGAKRYLFCSTERDAQVALDTHRRLFRRPRTQDEINSSSLR